MFANIISKIKSVAKPWVVAHPLSSLSGFLWILVFLLYLPAAKAGFVADFSGWLDQVRNHSFLEHINRTNYHGRSLYQFTQLATWVFYQVFGTNEWLWHLLFISIHVFNCILLFIFCNRLMIGYGVAKSKEVAFLGVTLFSISPYLSETLIWEPSYHFLQGLCFVLLVLNWSVRFIETGRKKYLAYAAFSYFLSTFSLEIFYITPWLLLLLGLLYNPNKLSNKLLIRQAFVSLFLPFLVLFLTHLVIFKLVYGGWVAHIASEVVASSPFNSLGKPAKYLFHLLFFGRFLPDSARHTIYSFLDSGKGLWLFYTLLVVALCYLIVRLKKLGGSGKFVLLITLYMLVALALLVPLWFGDSFYVSFDRYLYFTGAFFYLLLALALFNIRYKYLKQGILFVFVLASLRFTILVSRYWGKSARVIKGMMDTTPYAEKRTLLLLNLPEVMDGVPMIGAETESEYKLLYNLLHPSNQINAPVYDVVAYNMIAPTDGAHVRVINDNTIQVTLNQWGEWWWFAQRGAMNYENDAYKVNILEYGNTGAAYSIELKKPASDFILLFQTGCMLKTVDMTNKASDQY